MNGPAFVGDNDSLVDSSAVVAEPLVTNLSVIETEMPAAARGRLMARQATRWSHDGGWSPGVEGLTSGV